MSTTEIQNTIRDYYEQIYANKMDDIEEKEKFLEMQYPKTEPGRKKIWTDQLSVMKSN